MTAGNVSTASGRLTGIITNMRIVDVRFPTSRELDGSDAMNPDPDYSAAYVILRTDRGDGITGHGLTFTIGRGNEIVGRRRRGAAPNSWSARRSQRLPTRRAHSGSI